MTYKTLLFGVDDLFPQLQPLYEQAARFGLLDIVCYAVLENDGVRLVTSEGRLGGGVN